MKSVSVHKRRSAAAPPRCATRLGLDVNKAFRNERAVYDALRPVIELGKVGSYSLPAYHRALSRELGKSKLNSLQ
jgi:hypothetical protein